MSLLKLLATTAVCVWIVRYVDWAVFWESARDAQLGLIFVVAVMRFGGVTLSAYKWQQLLVVHSLTFRIGRLIRWYFIATFLNNFLPTNIGGDTYRVYKTLDNPRGRSSAVFAVLVERGTGLLALLVLGMTAALIVYERSGHPVAAAMLGMCAAGIVLGGAAVWLGRNGAALRRLGDRYTWAKRLRDVPALLSDFRHRPYRSLGVGIASFLFHLNKICALWLLLHAVGATMDPLALTAVVAGTDVIGLLPISIGGFGLIDGSFIYLAGAFGLAPEPALAAMLLHRVLTVLLSLVGAHFYMLGERAPRRPVIPAAEPVAGPVSPSRTNSF